MPVKYTKGKKKRGGKMRLTNVNNSHNSANFSSNKGAATGCMGCVNGDVQIGALCNLPTQADAAKSAKIGIATFMKGITGQVGGGNTAETTFNDLKNAAQNGMGYGRVPTTSVQNCLVTSPTGMGASLSPKPMSGGADITGRCVDGCNNLGNVGYGLNVPGTSQLNSLFEGSGYPAVSAYNTSSTCKTGGKKKKRKTRKQMRKHKRKSRKMKRGKKHMRKHTRKHKRKSRKMKRGKKHTRKHKRKSRKMKRGGYHQYQSNKALTPGFSSPNPGPNPWATGPLSHSRQVNCNDNYNHYTGKNMASPILDKAAPPTPFGGKAK